MLVRPENESVNSRFLHYKLLSPQVQYLMQEKAAGSTVPHLNVKDVRNLPLIDMPAKPVQDAIADVLGALDDKITVNDRIIGVSLELGTALFTQSKGTSKFPISQVASILMGQSPPSRTYNQEQIGIPFYQGNRDFGLRTPSKRVWCTTPTRSAKPGDVLVSVRAPVGAVNVAAESCGIGRGVAALRSDSNPHVLFYSLRADESIWEVYESGGTVFGSINKMQLSNLEISWPMEVLPELEAKLAAINMRVDQALRESASLAELRDTLLPRLMSGEIRVKDAERAVEEVT